MGGSGITSIIATNGVTVKVTEVGVIEGQTPRPPNFTQIRNEGTVYGPIVFPVGWVYAYFILEKGLEGVAHSRSPMLKNGTDEESLHRQYEGPVEVFHRVRRCSGGSGRASRPVRSSAFRRRRTSRAPHPRVYEMTRAV